MTDYSVNELLNNYHLNKSKLKLIGYKDNKNNENLLELKEEMDMLDYCINILPEEEKTIITNHYIKRMSLRQLSKVLIMARTTITRKLKNAENLLEKLLKSTKN